MTTDLLLSVVAAVLGLGAALSSQWIAKFKMSERLQLREATDFIARSVEEDNEAAQRAKLLALTTAYIPRGLTQTQFAELLNALAVQAPAPPPEERDAVEKLILGYHEQALSQAKAQFWFSVVAATVGFAWILYGGSEISADNLATTSRILPGVVLDGVAFLFFRQASETRQRATELYDRLRRDKQVAESVALVSSIEDVRVRSAVKAQIALHMSGIQPAPIELTNFLSSERAASKDDGRDSTNRAAT